VPTWVIDGTHSGSIKVEDGDYVLLAGEVTKNVTVKTGGTLVIQGGSVGKKLKLKGGTLVLDGGTIHGDLQAKSGVVEFSQGTIGKSFKIKGGVETIGDADSLLVIGRDLKGSTTDTVILGGNFSVGHNARVKSGTNMLLGSISVENDADFRVRGNADGFLLVSGTLDAAGDIDLRSRGAGGLTMDGDLIAGGNAKLHIDTNGGTLIMGGRATVSGRLSLHVDGSSTIVVSGNHFAGRVRIDGANQATINGTTTSLSSFDVNVGGDATVGGTLTGGEINWTTSGDTTIGEGGGLMGSIEGGFGSFFGDVTITSGGNTTIDGTVTAAGDLEITGPGTLLVTGNVQVTDLTDLAFFDVVELSSPDSFVTSGRVNISAGTSISLLSDLTGGGDVNLVSGGDTTIEGSVDALGSINLESNTLLVSGLLGAGVSIYSNTDDRSVVQDLSWAGSGDITFIAGTTLSIDGDLSAGGDVTLGAGTSTTVNGTVHASGFVDLLGTPTVVIGGSDLWGGDFRISGDSGVTIEATETLMLDGNIGSGGGDILLRGGLVGLWNFDDDAAQDSSGLMSAGGSVSVFGLSSLTVSVRNTPGPQGSIVAGTDILLTAPDYLELQGDYAWGGDQFSTSIPDPIVLEFGGTALFSNETGEFTIE